MQIYFKVKYVGPHFTLIHNYNIDTKVKEIVDYRANYNELMSSIIIWEI